MSGEIFGEEVAIGGTPTRHAGRRIEPLRGADRPAIGVGAQAGAPGRFGITIGGLAGPSDSCAPELAAARDGQPGPLPTAVARKPPKPADLLRSLLR